MHSERKITKEDTWRTAELRKHIKERDYSDENVRRRDDNERRHRGGQSAERRHRDPEHDRQDRDKLRKMERSYGNSQDRHTEQRKEGSRDRRSGKDRDRGEGRDKESRKRLTEDGKTVRRPGREETREREKDNTRERERHIDEDRSKRREDQDKDRRREEREREHRKERRRHEESLALLTDQIQKQHREKRDGRQKDPYDDKWRDTENRHKERRYVEHKDTRDYKEENRHHKEEKERRHREKAHHEEKQKHESRERRDLSKPGEEVRHHRDEKERSSSSKHREQRKKEEDDSDRKYKDTRSRYVEEAKDTERHQREKSSSRTHRPQTEKEQTQGVGIVSAEENEGTEAEEPVRENEDLENQEYEDDFEEYEEDFEEMDESADDNDEKQPEVREQKKEITVKQSKEVEAIQRAMAEENSRAGAAQLVPSREEKERPKLPKDSDRKTSQRGKFIDFTAAKQREVSKIVATKQKKRNTELQRLIDLDFSLTFSLLEIPPVNEYEMYIRSFGNANTKQAYVQCNEDNTDRDLQTEEICVCEKWTQHPPEHSGACGDPSFSKKGQDTSRSDGGAAGGGGGRKEITTKDENSGRRIMLLRFSQFQGHIMLSVHSPTPQPSSEPLSSSTIICIWNIWEPSRPQKMLLYESEVQCCCFSPRKSTLVFAGTSVGSVVLWDLREHAGSHQRVRIGTDEWTFRHPTFSTDAVMADSAHVSAVTSIEVVPSFTAGQLRPEFPLLASEEEALGLSFQLASLDESGLLNFWVVLELPEVNEAGSPTDLGLRPGGKVKLLHSSSLLTVERPSSKHAVKTRPPQMLLLKFLPTDSNHFFIGTNMGLVCHGTSHGLKAPPKNYRFQEVEERPVDVSAIHFSPFRPHLFLVGCGDGSIRLHAVSQDRPVAEWSNSTAGQAVVSVQWTRTRPAVFCVLDAASNLHVWDLLKDDAQPVLTERIQSDRVGVMAVFGDSVQQNAYSGIVLAFESGKTELHYLAKGFTVPFIAEEEKLDRMMTEAS